MRSGAAVPRRYPLNRVAVLDGSAAVLCALVLLAGSGSAHAPPSPPLRALMAVVVCAPIAVRRHRPFVQLALTLALGSAATIVVAGPLGWVFAPVTFLLYQITADAPRRRSVQAAVLCVLVLAGQTVAWYLRQPDPGNGDAVIAGLLLGGGWVLGDWVARHRDEVRRDRIRAAGQAVVEERLRIARDLHDIVAHGMSMIAVQAAYGGHRFVASAPPFRAGVKAHAGRAAKARAVL